MSMTLFAIGAAGVIGMQRATVQGTEDARRYDMAVNIANTWAARLQRDAMFWNVPYAGNANITTVNETTRYIKDTARLGDGKCEVDWCDPPTKATSTMSEESPYYDLLGREVHASSGDHAFCVQYRLTWVAVPAETAASVAPFPTAIARAEVRVVFRRLDQGIIQDCTKRVGTSETSGINMAPDATSQMYVHVTTHLRGNL